MSSSLCIFESTECIDLQPLVWVRPVWNLRCGILLLREKIERAYPGTVVHLHCRPHLAPHVREQLPGRAVNDAPTDACLYVNGQMIAGSDLRLKIPLAGPDLVYEAGGMIAAARVSGAAADRLSRRLAAGPLAPGDFADLPRTPIDVRMARYSWDLVNANGGQIAADAKPLLSAANTLVRGKVYTGAHLLEPAQITIGEGSRIKPGAVLDAEEGPIVIGDNVTVMPNAVIEGPVFIGDHSTVKIGAKIYGNTSIGPLCKIGGELEGSIVHSHANKQHEGFIGHAYLGMWVNVGADSNNSDLKNNYSTVRVTVNGREVDSGSQFVGVVMADHAKSGINTMFNTGTVVGVGCNVYGADFLPKYLPSFSWGGAEHLEAYALEKFLAVARKVMARRSVTLTVAEEELLRFVYEATAAERIFPQ
jgi:UDP-N-acetylglucosamine diphosphorylase/glucosamine-1-phosphate N-acetyltransferase